MMSSIEISDSTRLRHQHLVVNGGTHVIVDAKAIGSCPASAKSFLRAAMGIRSFGWRATAWACLIERIRDETGGSTVVS